MNENYIMLNGKRVDLTDEQIKKLGLKVKEGIFDRQNEGDKYYFISNGGTLNNTSEQNAIIDGSLYNVANYCTDKSIMQQRALHEILDRLLWRFSMQNDGDKICWRDDKFKYKIYFDHAANSFYVANNAFNQFIGNPYFYTEEIAQRAIDEIIKPFMKEHPEFVL